MTALPAAPISPGPIERGFYLGAGLGGGLACAYAICLTMAEAMRVAWFAHDLRVFVAWPVLTFTLGLPAVAMFATLAAFLGACTGASVGALWAIVQSAIPRRAFRWTGLLVCIVVVGLVHVVLDIRPEWGIPELMCCDRVPFGLYEAYISMIGIPSLIYMIAGVWGSERLTRCVIGESR
jgi:hypothetical protein